MPKARKVRGRWVVDFRDANNKRRRLTVKPNTRKEAYRFLRQVQDDAARGRVFDDPQLGHYASNWLTEKKATVKPGTWANYRAQVVRLCVYLGERRLSELRRPALVDFRETLMEAESELSPRTVNICMMVLGGILQRALQDGLIQSNPARLIPRLPEASREMDFLTHEEIPAVLDAAAEVSPEAHTLILAAIFTGLRRGELLALRWQDIDFKAESVRVVRSWRGGVFSEPKTRGSRRTVNLSPPLLTDLKAHRMRSGNPSGPVLVFQQDGRPLDPTSVTKRLWPRVLRSAGLRESLRFHDLRHTFAALLIHQGESPEYVKRQMGHSSIVVTMDSYGHIFPSEGKAAAAKLGQVARRSGHKSGT